MKKLVVLMLVVGMASLASATLSFADSGENVYADAVTINVGVGATVQLFVNDSVGGSAWTNGLGIGGSFPLVGTTVADLPNAGALGSFVYAFDGTAFPFAAHMYTMKAGDGASINIIAGNQMRIDFSTIGMSIGESDTLKIYTEDFNNVLRTITINVVPEPMTLALLGLGGLFLRRKK